MIEARPLSLVIGAAIVLLIAGLTHLSAILMLPRVASHDAYHLLLPKGTPGKMALLAAARPGDTAIPYRDPAATQGLCFFDLSKGPVRLKTTVEEGRLLTLSFRTGEGRIFYSMTDRAAFHHTIDIRLMTAAQLADVVANDNEDSGLPDELRLQAPSTTGLIVATALAAYPSERADAARRIIAISCATEPLPAAS